MTMNYMDTADDSLSYIFTPGQKLRLQAMLAAGGPRAGLIETPLAWPPGFYFVQVVADDQRFIRKLAITR